MHNCFSDCLPESPVSKRRNLIESDSEEEETRKPEKESNPKDANDNNTTKTFTPGRRKVSKTISKTSVNDEGFLGMLRLLLDHL